MSERQGKVVRVTTIPAHVFFEGPIPDGSRGTVSYSNHELGIKDLILETPLEFEIGDEASEAIFLETLTSMISLVSMATQKAFLEQLDRIDAEFKARRGYGPKAAIPENL